jgi:hypothetical protein
LRFRRESLPDAANRTARQGLKSESPVSQPTNGAIMSDPKTSWALSIRQPWCWLILHGGKDIENRKWSTRFRGRVLIHAGKTMTRFDYAECADFIAIIKREWRLPAFDLLKAECGGIVGEAEIVDCVTESQSPWFTGKYGFVMMNAKPLPFQPCKGTLAFFRMP